MIIDLISRLRALRIVLASSSPRRREILAKAGIEPSVIPSTFPEDLDKAAFAHAKDYVIENARRKALEVHARAGADADIIISSDSVVVCDERILEKPADEAAARAMMRMLSGRSHEVFTGVAIVVAGAMAARQAAGEGVKGDGGAAAVQVSDRPAAGEAARREDCAAAAVASHAKLPDGVTCTDLGAGEKMYLFAEGTAVDFDEVSDAMIDAYVRTSDPYDKAGGYGIQSTAAQFIRGIRGDYYNVMGFPLHRFCVVLRAALE